MSDTYKKRKEKLHAFFEKYGRLPSFEEMKKLFSVASKNTVSYWVEKFIKGGLIEKDATGRLIPKDIVGKVKILGFVEAGFPSPAEEELLDTISLDEYLVKNKEATFLLEISSDSMIDAGIHPEDLVLVERGMEPKGGDIVVAEVDGNWTLKRFEKKNGRVILVPENKKYKPIYPKESLNIGGVVVGVIRKYR